MRVIYFNGYGDFDAVYFESAKPNLEELYNEILGGRDYVEGDGYEADVRAYEFKDVDVDFIEFIRHNIQDYDTTKQSNFYIVEDGWDKKEEE